MRDAVRNKVRWKDAVRLPKILVLTVVLDLLEEPVRECCDLGVEVVVRGVQDAQACPKARAHKNKTNQNSHKLRCETAAALHTRLCSPLAALHTLVVCSLVQKDAGRRAIGRAMVTGGDGPRKVLSGESLLRHPCAARQEGVTTDRSKRKARSRRSD